MPVHAEKIGSLRTIVCGIMRHIPEDDVLQISLSLYKIIGEKMINGTSKILRLYRGFNIIVMIVILSANIANLFQIEAEMYISTLQGSLTVIHVCIKHNYQIFSVK